MPASAAATSTVQEEVIDDASGILKQFVETLYELSGRIMPVIEEGTDLIEGMNFKHQIQVIFAYGKVKEVKCAISDEALLIEDNLLSSSYMGKFVLERRRSTGVGGKSLTHNEVIGSQLKDQCMQLSNRAGDKKIIAGSREHAELWFQAINGFNTEQGGRAIDELKELECFDQIARPEGYNY